MKPLKPEIDKTGGLDTVRRSEIAKKYKATDIDRTKLFKTKADNLNKTSTQSFWNRKYNKYNRKSQNSSEEEKLIHIEKLGHRYMGVTFQNSYNEQIKDKIKAMPSAAYIAKDKVWRIDVAKKDQLIDAIAEDCL